MKIYLLMTVLGHLSTVSVFSFAVLLQAIVNAKPGCRDPLGMEDGTIKDHQITARTWLYFDQRDTRYYRPYLGRLHNKHGGGAWCSEEFQKYPGQLLEIDLQEDLKITEIATQGRYNGGEWVERFKIEYRRSNDSSFRKYKEYGVWKIFDGNNDTNTVAVHELGHPMIARVVRIYPLGNLFTIYCLRMELYGCKWSKYRAGLVSYSAPLGEVRKEVNLMDIDHDGYIDSALGLVSHGIGKLADDDYGSRSVRKSLVSPWVAYKKHPTVLMFYFKETRLFRSVSLHVNVRKRELRLFSEVNIEVEAEKSKYRHIKRYVPTEEERNRVDAFRVYIPLEGAIGTVLRLVFSHENSWLLLSEVDFDSVVPSVENTATETDGVTPTPLEKTGKQSEIERKLDIEKSGGKKVWNKKELEESRPVTGAKKLSFPIIITIVLVGAVVVALVITLFFRVCRKTKLSKEPVKYCHEYVTSTNSVRLKPSVNLYKFETSTPANGSTSGTLSRGLAPVGPSGHRGRVERRDKRNDFHRTMREFDTLSSSQTSELYRTSSPASEFCRHLNGRPSDCSCNCKDCGATMSSSSRSPSELYREDIVSMHSQTGRKFQGSVISSGTERINT